MFINSDAVITEDIEIGKGTVIMAGAVINSGMYYQYRFIG